MTTPEPEGAAPRSRSPKGEGHRPNDPAGSGGPPGDYEAVVTELRDALEEAIRRAYTSSGDGRSPRTDMTPLAPGRMRHLNRIQTAAWEVVKERVESSCGPPGDQERVQVEFERMRDLWKGRCDQLREALKEIARIDGRSGFHEGLREAGKIARAALSASCAECGTGLVADENRETGWRCPNESNHASQGEGRNFEREADERLAALEQHDGGVRPYKPTRASQGEQERP